MTNKLEELQKLHNKSAEEINKKRIIEILMTEKEDGSFEIEVNKIIDNEISNDIMKLLLNIFK